MDLKSDYNFESQETVEALLPVLAESGQIVPAIKVILDRNFSKSYSEILQQKARGKKKEIDEICAANYTDFIDAIDELLGVQMSVEQLKENINRLNQNIQNNGERLSKEMSLLLLYKQTRSNMDNTINKLNRLRYVLLLMYKIRQLMNKKKYIAALKNLNQLSSHHLMQLKQYTLSYNISESIPKLKYKIKSAVKTNFSEWLHIVNKESLLLGELAMKQTRLRLQSLERQNEDPSVNMEQQNSLAMQMQLQQQFGMFINFDDDKQQQSRNSKEILQQQMMKNLSLGAANSNSNSNATRGRQQLMVNETGQSLFEHIENLDFNAVYQCIHIHETLGSLDDFVSEYLKLRKDTRNSILNKAQILNTKYHSSTTKINSDGTINKHVHSDTARGSFRTDPIIQKKYFHGVCGFFVMEHHVSSRYQQLVTDEDVQLWWDYASKRVITRVKGEILEFAKLPRAVIDIKNEVYVLLKAMENYDFKVHELEQFLEQLRITFENRLLIILEKKVSKVLGMDKFTRLQLKQPSDYDCIVDYGLHVQIDVDQDQDEQKTNKNKNKNNLMDPDECDYENLKFPFYVPFSMSVPMICGEIEDFIQTYRDYARYLNDMNTHIRRAVEQLAIKDVVCKQLNQIILGAARGMNNNLNESIKSQTQKSNLNTSDNNDKNALGIKEFAQIAVNAIYLEKACTFFERELAADEQLLGQQQYMDFDDPEEVQISKMHDARKMFASVTSSAVDSLFEQFSNTLESILAKYVLEMDWTADKVNLNLGQWVFKLTDFLDTVKKQIAHLPQNYRDSAYFVGMSRINSFAIECLTGDDNEIRKINIISIYNFNLDITRLETYARNTRVADLHQCFKQIRQLLHLLLAGKNMVQYLDEDVRMRLYAYVQPNKLRVCLEKYKTLGLLTKNKLPKHVNNLDKKTVANMLKSLKDMA